MLGGRGGARGSPPTLSRTNPSPDPRQRCGEGWGVGGVPTDPVRRKGGVRMACGSGNAAKRLCRGSACGCGAGGAPQSFCRRSP